MSKYTKELLEPIVTAACSLSDVCRRLGKVPVGGNVNHIKQLLKKFNLSTSHFTGQAHNKGKTDPKRKSASEILIKSDNRQHGWKLRRALVESGRPECCSWCGLSTKWNHKPITLEIDHINGDRTDHREDNVRFLCPNCHSQTPTYSGRNK